MRRAAICCLLLLTSAVYSLRQALHSIDWVRSHGSVRHGQHTRLHSAEASFDVELEKSIRSMRPLALKRLLNSNDIDTRGMLEKEEFVSCLLEHEKKRASRCTTVPMTTVKFGNTQRTDYFALQLKLSNERGEAISSVFMLDSGASISLLKKEFASRLQLPVVPQVTTMASVGGAGFSPSTSSKVSVPQIEMSSTRGTRSGALRLKDMDFTMLENPAALPHDAAGLLGLDFLSKFKQDILFDFPRLKIKMGKNLDVVPLVQKMDWVSLATRKLYTGLSTVEVELGDSSTTTTNCVAMVDMGSLYTIANTPAVKSFYELTGTGSSNLDGLSNSDVVCAGIDGRPLPLKSFPVSKLHIGKQNALHFDTSSNGIFAADVPGLQAVGLGQSPALILGLDVLSQLQMVLRSGGDILMRKP